MAGLINDLMDKMGEMADCFQSLTELAHTKKDFIISNEVDSIKAITAQENTFVGRYQRLEKNVGVILDDIAMVLSQNRAELTLSRLGELIKEQDDYNAYTEVYGRLKQGVEQLKERNEQNSALIESALDYIDYTVNVIRTTYGTGNDVMLDTKN